MRWWNSAKEKKKQSSARPMAVRLSLLFVVACAIPQRSSAQFVIGDVIKLVAKKVINAIDLAVQKAQNKTIVLQNAEKELENAMAKLQLDGIADWVEKQRALYADYYQELLQVKQAITGYDKVRKIIATQRRIVSEYQYAFGLFRQDRHFTPAEIDYMHSVYSGILGQSLDNVNQVLLVIQSLVTQMDDAARLALIDDAAEKITRNENDLNAFNQANIRLSLNRSADAQDVQTVKALYGLP